MREELGLLAEVVGVAPGVRDEPPPLELDDPLRDRVEEVAIVRDEDERPLVRARQVRLEPFGGGDVEVVGRLVQDGDIGARDEELGQRDPAPLAAAARPARAIDVAHAELVKEPERLVPPLPTAEVDDPIVERRLLRDERVVAPAAVIGGREERAHFGVTGGGLAPGDQRVLDHFARALGRIELRLLRDVPDAEPTPHAHDAAVGGLYSGEDLGEGGFARAVHPDEADLLSAGEGEGGVVEDDLRAERLSQVLGIEGGHRGRHS